MSYLQNYRSMLITVFSLTTPLTSLAQGPLEEIVVTSAKRVQTLQEIPIAVTVTSADTILKAEIQDITDLQSIVPSLRVNTLQSSTNTNFSIRGFGNGANNPGIEPSVGVFIDGVYRSRSASSITDLPNLERIEVLRGPQSTLFGKNASSGVISIVTKTPTGESGGKVSATFGNYSTFILKAQLEGAVSDDVAFGISAVTNTRDGYFKNLETGGDLNNRDRQSVRGQLVFTPSDETQIRVIADYDQIDEECCGVNNLFESRLETFTNAVTGAKIIPNDPKALAGYFNIDPTNQIENSGISMQIDHEYRNFTLTSITAFRNTDSFSNIDADFSSGDFLTNDLSTEIDTFTQEIRLASNGEGNVDWMVGAFYFDETVKYNSNLPSGTGFRSLLDAITLAQGAPNALAGIEQALGLPIGQTFFSANGEVATEADMDNEAISLFGQVDWHINDKFTATLGLNYTKDEKQASVAQTSRDIFSSVDLDQLGFGLIFQGALAQGASPAAAAAIATNAIASGTNPLGGLKPLQFLPPFQDFPNAFEDGKTDDDELTYSFRLAYDLNDNINLYGGVSTGFKASSFNLSRDSRPTASTIAALSAAGLTVPNLAIGTRLASPEEATVYELGLKASFEKGSFNMAVFDQEIKGFQSNIFSGTAFNLSNAGKQSTKGVEFDLVYYPIDALKLGLAGTVMDPKFDSFVGALGVDGPTDLSGESVAGVHKVSLSFSATYNFVLGNGMSAYLRGDYQYDDKVQSNDNVPAIYASHEVKNLNLGAGVKTEMGWGFSAWGRNLTDYETITTGFPTVAGTGGYFGYRNQPRTYGVTISKEF